MPILFSSPPPRFSLSYRYIRISFITFYFYIIGLFSCIDTRSKASRLFASIMAYANLNDDGGSGHHETSAMMVTIDTDSSSVLFRHKVLTKFCTFGFVSGGTWDITYVVVLKGIVRVYDTEETFVNDPTGFVLEFNTSKKIFTSQIFEKDYSKDKASPILIKYCYLLKDNGMWAPTKQMKIGTSDKITLKRFIDALARSSRT
jgi:hypothetical protein